MMPGHLGRWAALTGARLAAPMMAATGVATHAIVADDGEAYDAYLTTIRERILACDDVGPRDAAPRFGSRAPVPSSARASGRAKRLPPARASPAGTRVLTSDDGAFDVSYGTVDQLPDISDTQARAFFEPVAPLVDRLLLQYFRADVSVTLDRKYAFLDSRRFAPLVAVERRPEAVSYTHLTLPTTPYV